MLENSFEIDFFLDSPLSSQPPTMSIDFKQLVIDKVLTAKCDENAFIDRCGDTILKLSLQNKGAVSENIVAILMEEIVKTIENAKKVIKILKINKIKNLMLFKFSF